VDLGESSSLEAGRVRALELERLGGPREQLPALDVWREAQAEFRGAQDKAVNLG
jgi:hypothetical protein